MIPDQPKSKPKLRLSATGGERTCGWCQDPQEHEGAGPLFKYLDGAGGEIKPRRRLLALAAKAMRPSARGYHQAMRVARTIADVAGSEGVGRVCVAEALSYRRQAPRN